LINEYFGRSFIANFAAICAGVAAGSVAYLGALRVLRLNEFDQLIQAIRRKLKR
jgi:hypothetical protein